MRLGFRVPTVALTGALLTLLAVLATVQYRWLGEISDAERERLTTTLNASAATFAQDFDRELTRAYVLFQIEASATDDVTAAEIAKRYQQWQATARFPELIKQIYVAGPSSAGDSLRAFDAAAENLRIVAWPQMFDPIRSRIAPPSVNAQSSKIRSHVFVMRTIGPPAWPSIPALVVPMPLVFTGKAGSATPVPVQPTLSYVILALNRDFIARKMLPALAEQHFQSAADGVDYDLAVVSSGSGAVLYHAPSSFSPPPDATADAAADLFAIRPQYFALLASDVSRFTQFTRQRSADGHGTTQTVVRESIATPAAGAPLAVWLRSGDPNLADKLASALPADRIAGALSPDSAAPHWRLLVKHPAGSLEIAVNAARRRNLAVSSGIFAVLTISIGLLVVSTRRAQTLARQQLEFVATVSHELRTPLAVIRSAADNLADGTVGDEQKVRQYGELVRREGVRLSDLVEQVLQFAGLQSGQRRLTLRPIELRTVVGEAAAACAQALPDVHVHIETTLPADLPPVRGDEAALRRVFQNLIGNAIKYGGRDSWVGIRAFRRGEYVSISVTDHGIGIATADHARVFEPFYRARDVVSAQIQGAGLGLSLVKRIVDAHGGHISLESTPGKGSSFTVTLPAVIDAASALTDASRADHVSHAASS